MMKCFTLILLCCFLCSFIVKTSAGDILYSNYTLKDEETIVSADGEFELGFFSPGSSKNRYLSIRYKKAGGIIVWVANRDAPLTDASGKLTLSSEGTLEIFNSTNSTIWSSNSPKSIKNPVAQLLNTGNLVIRTGNDPDIENFQWQSYDFPDNTLLPGMKVGKNLATGRDWSFSSWKSNDDPSPGNFQAELDISGYPQIFLWNDSDIYFRTGP
ncbi:Bulb-type lectin domain-containing protein [Heracleum sosnowskyi]|uniref:Bulb-type lectin domain-containing protein n=1 Tax=Heracleum sosnowskyi TaxID=360622 RepID=A0AAD8GQ38_9APIA|nr:Bulb-type lectin domain-containing protein [Heracleum sosnowskyi]